MMREVVVDDTPAAVPRSSIRRRTPRNAPERVGIVSVLIPTAAPTAIAASALRTL